MEIEIQVQVEGKAFLQSEITWTHPGWSQEGKGCSQENDFWNEPPRPTWSEKGKDSGIRPGRKEKESLHSKQNCPAENHWLKNLKGDKNK